jgi:hypothetical protein
MLIKTLAIELQGRNPEPICVALHAGTADAHLPCLFSKERSRGTVVYARSVCRVFAGRSCLSDTRSIGRGVRMGRTGNCALITTAGTASLRHD